MITSYEINEINQDLLRTKKAIVAIGCSFVQGAELSDNSEIKNKKSFINVLCQKYFQEKYTPINFGQESGGNFSAISRLFMYPINWKDLEEIILIFMPTDMQRFDFIRDNSKGQVGSEFKAIWPTTSFPKIPNDTVWINFNHGYGLTCYSKKFEVVNTILNIQFLKSWVDQYKAKLIIFPAFNKEYNKDYFTSALSEIIDRGSGTELVHTRSPGTSYPKEYVNFLIESVPWDKFIKIDNSDNFFDLCYKHDKNYDPNLPMQLVIANKLVYNNDWIMPRGHPSERGHNWLAKKLFGLLSKQNVETSGSFA